MTDIRIIVPAAAPTAAGGSAGDADITQLTKYTVAAVSDSDVTAYDALNVGSKSSGDSFDDPVVGSLTTKITDSTSPSSGHHVTIYSTMGLAISLAWGAGGDEYTLVFHSFSPSGIWLVDYKLGGTVSNFRSGVGGEGRVAFARSAGNEQILYVKSSSTQLRRYNTATNAYDDTGDFPYTWTTASDASCWLSMNNDDTRALAMTSGGAQATALDLTDGSVITASGGLDEPYMGSGDIAFIDRGGTQDHWDLSTDTVTTLTIPSGWSPLAHAGILDGFAFHNDVDAGGGTQRTTKILDNNTNTATQTIQGYWSDSHQSGHWWDVPVGTDPHSLFSHDNDFGSPNEPTWHSSLMFINCNDASKRILGHHYSLMGSGIIGTYYDQTHATVSNDGKLVMYTSNMNATTRHDVFVMEMPRVA